MGRLEIAYDEAIYFSSSELGRRFRWNAYFRRCGNKSTIVLKNVAFL